MTPKEKLKSSNVGDYVYITLIENFRNENGNYLLSGNIVGELISSNIDFFVSIDPAYFILKSNTIVRAAERKNISLRQIKNIEIQSVNGKEQINYYPSLI